MRKILAFVISLNIVFLLTQLKVPKEAYAGGELELNSKAIDFSLPDIRGKNYSLSQFKGKVVLLNFWATWCPPCRLEIPILNKIYKEYKKSEFEIIAVSLDTDVERLKNFLKENPVNFLVLLDKSGVIGFKYKVEAIPTSFLIDKAQILRQIYIGIIPEKEFISELKKWLKK
ncbi:MAG: TlpA family protein disulfide reductase [Thermodesulfobacterium geofontis]|uniref:TlpA family protein disulfide reductase n=1 Tax=Thermodesulfobacterium geofontis TaxID=1295609 RepID=A0A2N7PPQ3_9BACT|nr:MAG: TlpA family protein disulfide reductase [Thermodesulfobacterium geofontis]